MRAVMPASVVLFRALLIASVVIGLIGAFLDMLLPALVPASLWTAFEELAPPATAAIFSAGALVFITFGGMVTAIIGLYRFQSWARPLALWMTLLGLLFHPLLGANVQSGWAQMLLDLSSMLWGGVIAMSYVSSLSAHFESKPF